MVTQSKFKRMNLGPDSNPPPGPNFSFNCVFLYIVCLFGISGYQRTSVAYYCSRHVGNSTRSQLLYYYAYINVISISEFCSWSQSRSRPPPASVSDLLVWTTTLRITWLESLIGPKRTALFNYKKIHWSKTWASNIMELSAWHAQIIYNSAVTIMAKRSVKHTDLFEANTIGTEPVIGGKRTATFKNLRCSPQVLFT